MQFLTKVGMLSVFCFCLFCGVAFGHSDFNPKDENDDCVDYQKVGVMEYFWPTYAEGYGHEFGDGGERGPGHHTCFGHWQEYWRQQRAQEQSQEQSQQSEEDPPQENEPTTPNTDSDSTPSEGGEDSTTPTSETEPNTPTTTSGTSNAEPELRQSPEPAEMHCKNFTESECFEWDFHTYPYAGLPIIPEGIKTLGDLWHYWRQRTNNRNFEMRLMIDGRWEVFNGGYTSPLYDTPITPHLGIYMSRIKTAYTIGKPVAGGEIELVHPDDKVVSVHMVGFPEVPANYKMLSDIAEVDGVDWVQRRIRKDGRLRYETVYSAASATDDLIVRGQAVAIRIRKTVTLDLSGEIPEVAAAPSVNRRLTTSWARIKMHNPPR